MTSTGRPGLTDHEIATSAGRGSTADDRFAAIERLYGRGSGEVLAGLHVCVVGIGGVGSWAVESLARTGVGALTLIDHDDVDLGNVNRQLHALSTTLGCSKVELMRERVAGINPCCECRAVDDFLTSTTMKKYLLAGYDYVIDAIDSIKFKAAMIALCKRNKIPIVTTGGAGGRTDPTAIEVADLSRTWNDAFGRQSAITVARRVRLYQESQTPFWDRVRVFDTAAGLPERRRVGQLPKTRCSRCLFRLPIWLWFGELCHCGIWFYGCFSSR